MLSHLLHIPQKKVTVLYTPIPDLSLIHLHRINQPISILKGTRNLRHILLTSSFACVGCTIAPGRPFLPPGIGATEGGVKVLFLLVSLPYYCPVFLQREQERKGKERKEGKETYDCLRRKISIDITIISAHEICTWHAPVGWIWISFCDVGWDGISGKHPNLDEIGCPLFIHH